MQCVQVETGSHRGAESFSNNPETEASLALWQKYFRSHLLTQKKILRVCHLVMIDESSPV